MIELEKLRLIKNKEDELDSKAMEIRSAYPNLYFCIERNEIRIKGSEDAIAHLLLTFQVGE